MRKPLIYSLAIAFILASAQLASTETKTHNTHKQQHVSQKTKTTHSGVKSGRPGPDPDSAPPAESSGD
jgi:hypothetical protein